MGQVLIVDDDEPLAENLAEIIETLGVGTEIVADRASAMARARDRAFDVALVDVRLPDGDGIALISDLRRHSPFTEVVLVTGNATLEGAIAAVRGGAFAYVLKPFSPPDLLETVRRALAQAELYKERERLRGELERSEKRYRDLVEAVPSFVLSLDAAGLITTWNRRLEEVTGYRREEVIGRPGKDLVFSDEPRPLPVKDAPARLVRWHRSQVHLADGSVTTYAVGIDVTHEQEMLRRTMRAERLAAVGTMAAGFAHEVRNPLNSASLQLTLLERRLERGDATAEKLLPITRIVKDEIRRLDRLVGDFLAFAQPRPLELKPVDLTALLRSVLTLIVPEAEAAHVVVSAELARQLPPLLIDEQRLRQVLLNLVRNAFEAMPEGGNLTIRTRVEASGVELEIEDTGVGFPEDLPIFDAFFTTKAQGTGLGLSLVHRIVTDHGGTVRVRSRPGETCFTLWLPAASE